MKDAEMAYRESLDICRRMAHDDSATFQPYVMRALVSLGLLYNETQRMNEEETIYKEALVIARQLRRTIQRSTIQSSHNCWITTQRVREAEDSYREGLEIRRRLAKVNPDIYERYVAEALNNVGIAYFAAQQTNEPEA